jgi:hypothetical protein
MGAGIVRENRWGCREGEAGCESRSSAAVGICVASKDEDAARKAFPRRRSFLNRSIP